MDNEEYDRRRILAITGIQNRLGEEETNKFFEKVEKESRNELSLTNALTEESLRDRIIWRLELKLDQLIELERKGS